MPPGAPPGSPATWPCVTAFFWRCSPRSDRWPTTKRLAGSGRTYPKNVGQGGGRAPHQVTVIRPPRTSRAFFGATLRSLFTSATAPATSAEVAGHPVAIGPYRNEQAARHDLTRVTGAPQVLELKSQAAILRDTGQRLHRHPRAEAGGPRHPGHRKDARPAAIGSSQLGRGASTCDGGSGGSTGALSSAGTSGTGASGCQGSGPRLGSWKVTKQPPAWGCPATDPPTLM